MFITKRKTSLFKKSAALLTALSLIMSGVLGSGAAYGVMMPAGMPVVTGASLNGMSNTVIPFNVGRITDALYSGKSGSVVINIQDLHSHEETQKNIDTILKILDKKYGLEKVYVEGAYGQVNTKWLSGISDKKVKNQILSNMLESGRLTGSEYYAVESGRDEVLEGIEEKGVYRENLKRLKEIYGKKKEIEEYIPHIKYILEKKSEVYYSYNNRKLNRIVSKNKGGEISAEKYFSYLIQTARARGIELNRYREIIKFIDVLGKQKKIDTQRINGEISGLLEELKGQISYQEYKELTSKIGHKATESEFYFDLLKKAESKGLLSQSKYRDINVFFEYLILSQAVNPIELTYEEKGLVRELHSRNSVNEFEKEIYFLKEYVEYMEGYLGNKLTADEYEKFRAGGERFKLMWKKYVDADGIIELERYFGLFEEFYKQNVERNRYFIKNVMGIMPQEVKEGVRIKAEVDHQAKVLEEIGGKKEIKVVITGGFHTYGFTKLLEDEGISYIVVTPNVTESAATAEQKYEQVFEEQSEVLYETLQKMFVSQVGKGAVLNADVLKAVSGDRDMLSILNAMLADLKSGVVLKSFYKTADGFVFKTADGETINVETKNLKSETKEKQVLVSEKDLYDAFYAFDLIQKLNKKIRQAGRENSKISEFVSGKEIYSAAQSVEKIKNEFIRKELHTRLETISLIYKKSDSSNNGHENPVHGMSQALHQAQLAFKSRSWILSFIQPPVGGYIINADGIEGRGLNDTNSLIHAETLTIINFLENAAAKSSLPANEKKAVVLLLSQIKMNATSLKSDMFRNNRIVKKLKINYADKTVDDLFKETNELLKYADDILENPLASAELYCTLAPCNKCAKTIAKLKFKSVVFGSYPANKTHQDYEDLYSNGTEIISGILRRETDKYIRNYKIMNSTPLMTKIASSMQSVRRSAMSFFNFFKITRSKLYSEQQKDILLNKLFNNLSHSDFVYGSVEYALLCGNDDIETFKYAYEMVKNGKIKKLIISGGCGRLTVPLLKAVRESGIKNTGSESVEKFISMSNSEFSSLEKELSKASNSEIKTRLRNISPQISEAAIIKFIILSVIAKSDGISEKRKNNIESKIILETESSNTYENLQNSKKLLPLGVKNVAVIQTPVQQMRTMGTANRILDPNIALYSMTVNKTNKNYSELLQSVLGEYARLIVYTLKGDIAPKDSFQNAGLNAVSEDIYDSILSLMETFDVKQASLVRTNLRNLFKALGNDSYEKVLELLNQKALADKVSQIKLEKIKSFVDWIYEDPGVLPQTVFFNNGRHAVSKAFMTAFLESPYIFASSFSEKFREWFLRQHSPDNKEIRAKGLNRITAIVRASTFIAGAVLAFSVFYAVPSVTLILAAVQWIISLTVPHALWNIKHPEAKLSKTPFGQMKDYDIYRNGVYIGTKFSTSAESVLDKTAYTLAGGVLWKKNEIKYELTAKLSKSQSTQAPQIKDFTKHSDVKADNISENGSYFTVIIANVNDKLPAEYTHVYASSPKGAVAKILFKIFEAIKDGRLTNGKYVNIPYVAADESLPDEESAENTAENTASDNNIIKILSFIFKDYNLGDIIENHRSSSLPLRTEIAVSRNVKEDIKAYRVVIQGLNKHKNLEVYQEVYAASEEEAVKNAVRELAAAKERGELKGGWYADIALNRKNVDKIADDIISKYKDNLSRIAVEISEVKKITDAVETPEKNKKRNVKELIQTSRHLYLQPVQNDKYVFNFTIQIPNSSKIKTYTIEAYSPKQALFEAFYQYYGNKNMALQAERGVWENYNAKKFTEIFGYAMNIPAFTLSDRISPPSQRRAGERKYEVIVPGLNDTKELAPYTVVYAKNSQEALTKAVTAIAVAKEKGILSAGWYGGIAVTKSKINDISRQILKEYETKFIISEINDENEIIIQEISEISALMDWNNISNSDLSKLKMLLQKIEAWDDKLARAGMIYAMEHKVKSEIDKNGRIRFFDAQGNILNFWIDFDGRFCASKSFYNKMGTLSKILNVADMDENIAPRAKVMGARMKNVFSKLHLYGIGNPVIVTGAIFERLKSRIDDINPIIMELVDNIFVVSARERMYFLDGKWTLDDPYLDDFSRARMQKFDKKVIRESFYEDIEVPWHNLFLNFADSIQILLTENRKPSYEEFLNAVLKNDYNSEIDYTASLLNLDRGGFFNLFDSKKRKEIKDIINLIYSQTKAHSDKDKLLKVMRFISLLELIRVYRSQNEEDFSEKDYVMSEAFKREPMVANNERTTYIVTQIRPMAVRDCLVDYCSGVIKEKGLTHFSIRAGGKSTIDFFKNSTNKAIAIEYLAQRFNIPSESIIYSGDELFNGVDECVADLKKNNPDYKDLVIINTGRDNVNGTLFLKDLYPGLSGIDANTVMFEKLSDLIDYNIGLIASDADYEPSNVVQDLNSEALQYASQRGSKIRFKGSLKQGITIISAAARNLKKIIIFLQLMAVNIIYKDSTSYTLITDAEDLQGIAAAQYLASSGIKVNLILKGNSGLTSENKRALEHGFALFEENENLTKYGYESLTGESDDQMLFELIRDVANEDVSKNKIINVSESAAAGRGLKEFEDIFETNGSEVVVDSSKNPAVLFLKLAEKIKNKNSYSVIPAKPLVSVDITQEEIERYCDREYLKRNKSSGIESIVIAVNSDILQKDAALIETLLKNAHDESLKVEFLYSAANIKEFEKLVLTAGEMFKKFKIKGTGIDGLRLNLSKLTYSPSLKNGLLKLKMDINSQNLYSLFAVELYDIPKEFSDEYKTFLNNAAIISVKSIDKIEPGTDLSKTIIKLSVDKRYNTVFDIKVILQMNPSMIQMSSDLLENITKNDRNFLTDTIASAAKVLNIVYDSSPEGMYLRGLETGRRTSQNINISARDFDELYKILKSARAGSEEIFESEIFKKFYKYDDNIDKARGFIQGLLEISEYKKYSASGKHVDFVNAEFKYVLASALVENHILAQEPPSGNTGNSFAGEQITAARNLIASADAESASQYYDNINTAVNILNGIKSMDQSMVSSADKKEAISLMLEILPLAERYVQMSFDDKDSQADIAKITKAFLASA